MRYVLIGTGSISNTYVAALSGLEGSKLVACVSRSGRRPSAAPGIECCRSLDAVAAPFDAVIITTPNGLHQDGALAAARLGKHVLTEKPLAITRPAMSAMIEACARAGVTLAVAFQHRTHPDVLALKRLLEAGALGRIYAADLSCKFWRDQAYYDSAPYRGGLDIDGGGPFMQQACHNIDLYQWFFGLPDELVAHRATFAHRIEAEDHGAVLLRHANGMIGTIVASTAARPGLPARLEVVCEKGIVVTLDDRIVNWDIDGVANPGQGAAIAAAPNVATLGDSARHQAILRDFEAAVRDGRAPLADAESARRTVELILRIYGR
ncbi:Gfo/Idh/MocA family protein [Paludibacterium yongneupense]|uniref:Gfo/Idh/MocA family protein n=1 Tax=Paludibacterium yongneupense TaxID=400061 RepID=UPI001469BEDA|nr:Gfo/Idh/MocA family oxidoreductase [Paludibacterium yongneupense]